MIQPATKEFATQKKIQRLKPFATLAINEYSNELIKQGKKVYKLGLVGSADPRRDGVAKNNFSK